MRVSIVTVILMCAVDIGSGYSGLPVEKPLVNNSSAEVDALRKAIDEHIYRIRYPRHYKHRLGGMEPLRGDILLTPTQTGLLRTMQQNPGKYKRRRRKVAQFKLSRLPYRKWNLPIHFAIDPKAFSPTERRIIVESLNHWTRETCITFNELESAANATEQSLYFTYLQDRSFSFVSRCINCDFVGFLQPISLGSTLFSSGIGPVVHEVGHAIGFWHEHERPDRGQYIRINDHNIMAGKKSQFWIGEAGEMQRFNLPYDRASIMHYHSKAFSTSTDLPTVETLDPLYQATIGQKVGLSFLDARQANLAYCSEQCANTLPCQNGAYMDPLNCTRCRCQDGFSGIYCELPDSQGSEECEPTSGTIPVLPSSIASCVHSPHYQNGAYKQGEQCSWWLVAPTGCRIELYFAGEFGLYCHPHWGDACFHWVEIKTDVGSLDTGPRFCCQQKPAFGGNETLVSSSHKVIVTFRSNYVIENESRRNASQRGFKLCYSLYNESCVVTEAVSQAIAPWSQHTSQSLLNMTDTSIALAFTSGSAKVPRHVMDQSAQASSGQPLNMKLIVMMLFVPAMVAFETST